MRIEGGFTATIGAVVGSLVLGGAGLSLWLLPCDDTAGLDCLGPAILGVFAAMAGFILGSLIGCYVALRMRKHVKAGATVPVLIGLGAVAGFGSLGLQYVGVPSWVFPVLGVVAWLGLPFLARAIVMDAVGKARSRRSGAPVDI